MIPKINRILKIALGFLLLLPFLVSSIVTLYIIFIDYDLFVNKLLELASKEGWQNYFRKKILSETAYYNLRLILPVFLIFFLSIFIVFRKKLGLASEKVIYDIKIIKSTFKKQFSELTSFQKYTLAIIFLIFILRALYANYLYELQYDEAWTFNHFSSKGMIVSAISPNNNHTFYTIISATFYKLGITAKWAIRMPSFIFGFASLIVLFVSIRKLISTEVAFYTIIIAAYSNCFYFYSVLGRGYGPMLFFTLISVVSLLQFANNENSETSFRLYLISTIFGFYSSFAFVYPWISILIIFPILIHKSKKIYFKFLLINLIAVFITSILYAPMIIGGALNILTEASEQNLIVRKNELIYLNHLTDWLFLGKKKPLFIPFLIIIISFLTLTSFLKKQKKIIYAMSILSIFPFAIFLITAIEIPYRIFSYSPIFLWICISILISQLVPNRLLKISIVAFILFFNLWSSSTHYFMNWSAGLDREAKKIAEIMLVKASDTTDCYSFSRYDKPLIEYYFTKESKVINVFMPFKESNNFRPFDEQKYDYVILDIDDYIPQSIDLETIKIKKYKEIYRNHRIILYTNI